MAQFDKSVTFAAVDIALLTKARPEMIHTGLKSVFSYFEQGFLYPVYPVTTFPMGQIHDAFRLIATRKHTGKLVMIADKQTKVKASPLKPSTLNLGGGTYIVAGGLGDLGKRICVLLASKGAGNIVSFSRRTLDDNIKQEFKKDIEQLGSRLHIIQCDITDETSMAKAKSFCVENLPPVRGIIHGGMVLRVRFSSSPNLTPNLTLAHIFRITLSNICPWKIIIRHFAQRYMALSIFTVHLLLTASHFLSASPPLQVSSE